MRRILIVLLLIAGPSLLHAQILSVYGTYSPLHLTDATYSSTYTATSGQDGTTTTNNSSAWLNGFNLGATVGIGHFGPVHLGIDFRGTPVRIGAPSVSDFFGGLKVGFDVPVLKLKPYVQASGGAVFLYTTNTTSYYDGAGSVANYKTIASVNGQRTGAFEVLAGVDYPLARLLDVRVIEVGGGRAATSPFGANIQSPDHALFSVQTGIVAHF